MWWLQSKWVPIHGVLILCGCFLSQFYGSTFNEEWQKDEVLWHPFHFSASSACAHWPLCNLWSKVPCIGNGGKKPHAWQAIGAYKRVNVSDDAFMNCNIWGGIFCILSPTLQGLELFSPNPSMIQNKWPSPHPPPLPQQSPRIRRRHNLHNYALAQRMGATMCVAVLALPHLAPQPPKGLPLRQRGRPGGVTLVCIHFITCMIKNSQSHTCIFAFESDKHW